MEACGLDLGSFGSVDVSEILPCCHMSMSCDFGTVGSRSVE